MADIESEEFNDTCVHGFHVYKDVWRPVIGEELRYQREEYNPRDPYAVAVTSAVIFGHVAPPSYEGIQGVP